MSANPEKLIIAVHGIGEQFRFATIQSVARRIAHFYGPPVGIPLGSFHLQNKGQALPFRGKPDLNLGEVFWADIPRSIVDKKDELEETKAWAQTVVERVQALEVATCATTAQEKRRISDDYSRASTVVAEMIQTISVLENLTFLAEKAGLLEFDLRKLLDDYLGDVQVVADFENYGKQIVSVLHYSVTSMLKQNSQIDEIHFVAHSEGTVVAFLAILEAFSDPTNPQHAWVEKLRSLMTIGSPIDKHLVLWPHLWKAFESGPKRTATQPIRWFNYYDMGDPVGFELDGIREWLKINDWTGRTGPAATDIFHFPPENELSFTRYYFPGKAHTDYWDDSAVFDHYLTNGVGLRANRPLKKLKNRTIAQITSTLVPYVLCFGLVWFGSYLLFKGYVVYLNGTDASLTRTILESLGVASLISGVTVLSRVPRIVRRNAAWLIAAESFVLGALVFLWLIDPNTFSFIASVFPESFGDFKYWAITVVASLIAVIAGLICRFKPKAGMWPLMILGGIVIVGLMVVSALSVTGDIVLWPMLLCTGAFLYLWWLAALLFDLIFVWHWYIRGDFVYEKIKALCASKTAAAKHQAALAA